MFGLGHLWRFKMSKNNDYISSHSKSLKHLAVFIWHKKLWVPIYNTFPNPNLQSHILIVNPKFQSLIPILIPSSNHTSHFHIRISLWKMSWTKWKILPLITSLAAPFSCSSIFRWIIHYFHLSFDGLWPINAYKTSNKLFYTLCRKLWHMRKQVGAELGQAQPSWS